MAISKGERIGFRAKFENDEGDLADPISPVELKLRAPDGSLLGPRNMSKESTGIYEHREVVDQVGIYRWKVETGDGFEEEGRQFEVEPDI